MAVTIGDEVLRYARDDMNQFMHPLRRACSGEGTLTFEPSHHALMVRMNTGSRVPGLIENTASEWTMLPSSSVVKTLVTPL